VAESNRAMLTSVARMYYLDGLGQSEIASIFGVSRSTVSRLLTAARDRGVVRISVDDYDPRDTMLERALIDRFGLRRAIVVRSLEGQPGNARRTVGYFAANIVAEWLADAHSIGVAGGRTIGQMIHFIAPRPEQAGSAPEIVQLMGTVGSTPNSVDASELARTLARRLHGSFHTINAPAFMDDARSRDLLLSHSQIRTVWSKLPTLDISIVGIGTLVDSVFADRSVLSVADLETLRAAGAVGEICGHFFDARGRECRSPLQERVIGVELETLRRSPEVIAVTAGSARHEAVRAALVGQLVHTLVIDDAGATAVLDGPEAVARRTEAGYARP
jgi:DNA-binding transcriptional regulator LsrR (DeoR family)